MSIEKLDHLSLLMITGDDALSFLQGQLTNDIMLADKAWQYSGYCNPKGRLLALLSLWRHEDTVYALLDKSLTEAIIKRLTMYIMRSNVNIELAEHQCFGLLDTPESIEKIINVKSEIISSINHRHGIYSDGKNHILGYSDRFLYITQNENIKPSLINESNQWPDLSIQEGLPEITASTAEMFIPQMLNLDILKGINFKKGCYTGQEIIARMHYLGKSKQRMFVCDIANRGSSKISAGDKIYSDQSLKKSIGNIVSIQGDKALAALRIDNEITNSFLLNETVSIKTITTQPYSLEIN